MLLPRIIGKLPAAMPKGHRDYHPAKHTRAEGAKTSRRKVEIPKGVEQFEIRFSGREVKLTNLKKLFWPDLKITKRDLIQYYADVASVLLPHLQDRAMVMKRYPNGAAGDFFFMKRAPSPRPPCLGVPSAGGTPAGAPDGVTRAFRLFCENRAS